MIFAMNAIKRSKLLDTEMISNSRRILKSFEKKIGQKNLAEGFGVSTSTIRRWKKQNRMPGRYKEKLDVYKLKLKNVKPTKKLKLKNKRFDKIKKYQSVKFYQYTRTENIEVEIFDFDEIPETIIELSKQKINGYPVEYGWITLNALTAEEQPIFISSPSYHLDELLKEWKSEIDILMQNYAVNFVISVTISGKSFQF